jgi:tetratricopeptide (TPR) repeat protein
MTLPSSPSKSRLERLGAYLEVDPDNRQLLRDYAVEAMREHEYRACARAVERLRDAQQANRDDCLLLARAQRLDQRADDAMRTLADAARRWPDDSGIAFETAACHFAEMSFDAALDALPDLAPDAALAAEVCAMRVRLLHHLGHLGEAQAVADEFQETQEHESTPVARALLPVLMDLSKVDDAQVLALALVRRAGQDEPLAAAALDRDDLGDARQWIDHALLLRQDDGRVWLLKGLSELRGGATVGAIDALERACALLPSHAGSQLALGWAFLIAADLERANAAFETAVRASPSFAETHGSLAVVAAMQHRSADASSLIRRAQRLDRHCASAQWAQQVMNGSIDPEHVSLTATQVIARARGQRVPVSSWPPHPS